MKGTILLFGLIFSGYSLADESNCVKLSVLPKSKQQVVFDLTKEIAYKLKRPSDEVNQDQVSHDIRFESKLKNNLLQCQTDILVHVSEAIKNNKQIKQEKPLPKNLEGTNCTKLGHLSPSSISTSIEFIKEISKNTIQSVFTGEEDSAKEQIKRERLLDTILSHCKLDAYNEMLRLMTEKLEDNSTAKDKNIDESERDMTKELPNSNKTPDTPLKIKSN